MKALALLLLAGCPSKQSYERELDDIVEKTATFRDAICACTEKTCMQKVHDEMTAWALATRQQLVQENKRVSTDRATVEKLDRLHDGYYDCLQAIYNVPPAQPPEVPVAAPTDDVDHQLRDVRAWARTTHPGHILISAEFQNVDENGRLAPDGFISVLFGHPKRPHAREVGALVLLQATPDDCFFVKRSPGMAWSRAWYPCGEGDDVAIESTVPAIWKRAVAEYHAPATGLATVSVRTGPDRLAWQFSVGELSEVLDD